MTKYLAIYCAGGYGLEILDLAIRINKNEEKWKNIVFVDDTPEKNGTMRNGILVYPFDWVTSHPERSEFKFVIANGEPSARKSISDKLRNENFKLDILIDPNSVVSPSAQIDEGVIISQYACVGPNVHLGSNVSLNIGANVGHDIVIGENSVLSSMVVVGGESHVGSCSYIGMGALVKEKLSIGTNVIVGMGSVVYYDIQDGLIALGNPARVVQKSINKKIFDSK
jgi:sugar O-acyltransferase (sialic acid O-acetyltransferase NeuD family)